MKKIKIKKLHEDAIIPTRGHYNDSGLDLYALEDTIISPGETVVIRTGIAVDLEDGYEAQVRPRSGITSKTSLRVQLGTVDTGYTGDIGVMVQNTKDYGRGFSYYGYNVKEDIQDLGQSKVIKNSYVIKKGDKIAQLVIAPVVYPEVELVEDFDKETDRGSNGYGSTGH